MGVWLRIVVARVCERSTVGSVHEYPERKVGHRSSRLDTQAEYLF